VLGHPRQLTAGPGWEADPAISPDGEFIAYSSNLSGNADIWLIDARGGEPIQLTDDPALDRMPTWLPDGSGILFYSERAAGVGIWRVPRLGGPATMLIPEAMDPAISHDGTRIALSRADETGMARIAVLNLSALDRPAFLTDDDDGFWNHRSPTWSPRGDLVCYSDSRDLWVVPEHGGEARRLTQDGAGDFEPVWSPDGRHVVFSSYREGTFALWRVPLASGKPQRLTFGTGPERQPSVSQDGVKLAYSTFAEDFDVELVDLVNGQHSRLPEHRYEAGPTLSPDASAVVFSSDRAGSIGLWRQALNGLEPIGAAVLLNRDRGASSNPDYSPDGRWIAYQRRFGGQRDIWIQPAMGGLPHALTDDSAVDLHPEWSPDSSQIVFVSDRAGKSDLWVAQLDEGQITGPLRQLSTEVDSLMSPTWSPNGQVIAFAGVREGAWDIWVIRADGTRVALRVTSGAGAYRVRWKGDGGKLLVIGSWKTGELMLREVDSETGASTPLEPPIQLGPTAIGGPFDISVDGEVLALTREETRGDLWVMDVEAGSF
jgi:Tol biopolymer transport system component